MVEEKTQNECIGKSSNGPLITIITATYNAEFYLQELVDSIRRQTYPNIEWIVIDGGSKDETKNILKTNEDVIGFWLSEKDDGIYDAWNKGLAHAHGDWIYFLGADDLLRDNNALACMAKFLVDVPEEMEIAYAQIMLLSEDARDIFAAGEPWGGIKRRFAQVMCLPHQGVFHRRSLFEKHGNFNTTFRIAGDYELLLRELKNGDAAFFPMVVAGMRQGGISNEPMNTIKALQEIRLAQKIHGFEIPGRIWALAYMRSYLRTWAWKILGKRRVVRLLDAYRRMMRLPEYWTKL